MGIHDVINNPALAEACRKVMLNPFSDAITGAVVPDGKMQMSSGLKLQSIKEMTMDSTGKLEFLIFPGYGNAVAVWGDTRQVETAAPIPTGEKRAYTVMQPFAYEGQFNFDMNEVDTNSVKTITQATPTMSTWRLVSQGVKLSLTNNSDQNDGWWESIRIPTPTEATWWCYANVVDTPTDAPKVSNGVVTAKQSSWKPRLDPLNLADKNSYESGRIRDLDQHVFINKCINNDRNPIDVKETYNYDNSEFKYSTQYGNTPSADGQKFVQSVAYNGVNGIHAEWESANTRQFTSENLDANFDTIYVVLHGRPTSAAGTTNTPTRILSHAIAHHEHVYAETENLSRTMRPAPFSQKVMTYVAQAMNGMTRSAMPMPRDGTMTLATKKRKRTTKRAAPRKRVMKTTQRRYTTRRTTKKRKMTYRRKPKTTRKRTKY